MSEQDRKRESNIIATGDSQSLAKRSASLAARGLHALDSRDTREVIEAAKRITSSLQETDTLRVVAEEISRVLHCGTWSLLLADIQSQDLHFEFVSGKTAEKLQTARIKLGEGIIGWVAKTSEAAIVPDTRKDSRFLQSTDGTIDAETRSIAAFPLRFRGRCLGVIAWVNYTDSIGFFDAELMSLEVLADFAAIAIENGRHVMAIHELTITDLQTGLYNSRHLAFMLDTEVYRSERYGYEFSLVAIDSSLRSLSASLTYDAFNRLLSDVASVVKAQCRLIDFAFRYDVGEFMLLLPQTTKEKSLVVAQRAANLLTRTSWLSTTKLHPVVASVSFPSDGKTKTDLLAKLDERLRSAKGIRTG